MRRLIGLAAAVFITAPAAWLAWAESPGELPAPRSYAGEPAVSGAAAAGRSAADFHFRGARSCGAVACHGDADASASPRDAWRRSYLTWVERDPHARSYETLETPLSRAILERLGILAGGRLLDRRGYANCRACHNPAPPREQRRPSYFVREGVGCEQCHGPSDAWAGVHHLPGWNREALSRLGMTRTHDLTVRAAVCVDCHVGAPGREVNHDMLAAGHPPLVFEFSAFLDRLPKHWDENRERIAHNNFELQAWLAGQTASAGAALRLVESRAERAGRGEAVWPEFAEYDCRACHHDLTPSVLRHVNELDGRGLGTLSWGDWHFPLMERIASPQAGRAIGELRLLMESSLVPDPGAVEGHAAAALAAHRFLNRSPAEVLASLAANMENAAAGELDPALASDRERAAQLYLAFVAIDRAYHDERQKRRRPVTSADRQITADLHRLRGSLASPERVDTADMNDVYNQLRRRTAAAASRSARP